MPADATLHSATALSLDESILTGESLPADKNAAADSADEAARVYSGTLVVRGYGAAEVVATGERTEIGPEEFPLVLTVFLAIGAWRISRADVLTRRMPAVEAIGAGRLLRST